MVEEAAAISEVRVPPVPAREVSLGDEYERVRQELWGMSEAFRAAGDRTLAMRITTGPPGMGSLVEYNPNALVPIERSEGDPSPLDVDDLLRLRYGDDMRTGMEQLRLGKRLYNLGANGSVKVREIQLNPEGKKIGVGWSRDEHATAN